MEHPNYGFEIFNGSFTAAGTALYNASNRGLRYGDGLYETIKVVHKKPLFISDHFKRLKEGMKILELHAGQGFDEEMLVNMIQLLLKKNNVETCRMRLIVFRSGEGFYKPENNSASWSLVCSGSCEQTYNSTGKPLRLGIYKSDYKSTGLLSNVKTLNGLIFVHASLEAAARGFDEMIITNTRGNCIEAISSNLFLVKDNEIFTPPLSDGCLAGITRKQILAMGEISDLRIYEKSISEADFEIATEIVLTNVVRGAQHVAEFNGKNYSQNIFAGKMNNLLNKIS